MKARCMKCKKDQDVKDPKKVKTKNNRWMMSGTCSVCGTKMSKMIGKADADKLSE